MNRKQFIILLVVVALVGAAGWIVHQRGQQSWQSSGQAAGGKLLPNFQINNVAQINIQSGTNDLTLAKKDHLWRVRQRADYPADFSKISDLLMKFSNLKIVQNEAVGPAELGRFDLLPPGPATNTATRLAFKDSSGKTLASLLLGKKHMAQAPANSQFGGQGWPDGRYVMTRSGAKTVAVISDPLDDVDPSPQSWLDKSFFRIENPESIALSFPVATNSWKLTRASVTNAWQLAGARPGEKLDATKISTVTSPFSSPTFDDVSRGSSDLTNATVLTAKTFDGFDYTVRIGPKRNDDYPVTLSVAATLPSEPVLATNATPAETTNSETAFQKRHKQLADKLAKEKQLENWTYSVPAYIVEPVIKHRSQLLAEVKTEASTNAPAVTEK